MQAPQRKPPVGVVFDTSLDDVDQMLALALLFGADGKRLIRLPSVSTSRFSLDAAAFLDIVARFFAGEQPGEAAVRSPLSIGMTASGREAPATPLVSSVLDKRSADGTPVYRRAIGRLNDTADPVALMRNALSAQEDRNGAVVLAGLPGNLTALAALPDGREWVARKARVLAIAGGRFDNGAADPLIRQDIAGFRALLTSWPAPIVMAGTELNDALPFPGSSLDTSLAWARHHPIADAYRAFKPMPYDGPSRALAAALHVMSPDDGYFDLSEPGTITVLDDGRTRFTASPQGRHRYLIAKPSERARVLDVYVQTTSAQPQRQGRRGGGAAALGIRDPDPLVAELKLGASKAR